MCILPEIKIWSRFERILPGGKIVKLKIHSVPNGKEDQVAEFMCENIKEEVWFKSSGIAKNPIAMEEYKSLVLNVLKMRLTVVCSLDKEDENEDQLFIVGMNLLYLAQKGVELELHFESDEMKRFINTAKHAAARYDVFKNYDVENCVKGAGLAVHPYYRGCGIAVEILKARLPLCRHAGILLTATMFTSGTSQRAAERVGFVTVFHLDYKTFGDVCGLTFLTDSTEIQMKTLEIL